MKKKSLYLLSFLLVLALSLSIFVVGSFANSKEPTGDEVTLTITPRIGKEKKVVCSFDEAMSKLQSIINLKTPTTYTISLNKDAYHTKYSEIAKYVADHNRYATVNVNLNGYTLTSSAPGGIFVMNRAISSFTLDGGNNASGEKGKIVTEAPYGEVLFVMKNGYTGFSNVTVKNVSVYATNLNSDCSVISCNNGKLDMRDVDIKLPSSATAAERLKLLRLSYIEAKLVNCNISDDSSTVASHAIHASGNCKVVLENSAINADIAIYSGDSRSDTLSSSFLMTSSVVSSTDTAFYIDCDRTNTTLLGTSVYAGNGNIVGGKLAAGKLFVGYTTYSVVLEGADVDTVSTMLDDGYIIDQSGKLVYDYLSDSNYTGSGAPEAILTVAQTNGSVSSKSGALTSLLTELGEKTIENGAVVSITLLNNASMDGGTALPDQDGASIYFTLNGKSVTVTSEGRIFALEKSTLTLNGDGGSISLYNGVAQTLASLGASKGYNTIKDVTVTVNSPKVGGNLMEVGAGTLNIDGLTVINLGVAGTSTTSTASSPVAFIKASGDATVIVNNTSFVDNATYNAYTLGAFASDNSNISLINSTVSELTSAVKSTDNAVVKVLGSTISVKNAAYLGDGYIYVTDTETTLDTAELTSDGSSKILFLYGNGTNTVKLPAGVDATGIYSVEDGYTLGKNNEGIYVMGIKSTLNITSDFVTTKKLQVGAIFEIAGTCDKNGATITVKVDNDLKTATVENGSWSVEFGPYEAKSGVTVTVTEEGALNGTVTVSDVSFTEVNEQSISLPIIFANNMVLQRQMPINIYGFGKNDGMAVKAELKNGNTVISSAVSYVDNGKFTITLPACEAAYNLTLTVEEVGVTNPAPKNYTGVNVGEIWVVSGQSNSDAVRALHLEDMEEYFLNANNFKNVRIYTQGWNRKAYADELGSNATWYNMSGSYFNNVAATAYVALSRVAATLGEDVPIAIIQGAHSSSLIAPWISEEEMRELNAEAKVNMSSSDTWSEAYSFSSAYLRYLEGFQKYYDTYGAQATSSDSNKFTSLTGLSYKREDQCSAAACYNGVYAHMNGFSARGVIWYQGETDVMSGNIESYPMFFDALTDTFKTTFNNDELAMIVMQLAPYGVSDTASKPYVNENSLARFKAIQEQMCRERENTYLVSLATNGSNFTYSDLYVGGGSSHIHPAGKSPLGVRAANIILYEVYGLSDGVLEFTSAPKPIKAEKVDNTIVVTFDSNLYAFFGKGALGFEMSDVVNHNAKGDDLNTKNEASWYSVEGLIEGNKVILTIPDGKNPEGVRYAHGNPYVENRDGTLVEYNYSQEYPAGGALSDYKKIENYTPAYITDVKTGVTYTYYALNGDNIRMLSYGNITNESGEPMPLFKLDITK